LNELERRAVAWMIATPSMHAGKSAQSIMCHLLGIELPDYPHPLDGADVGRCLRMLESFPEFAGRIGEMKSATDVWSCLAERWGELAQAYNANDGARCYEIIRECEAKK